MVKELEVLDRVGEVLSGRTIVKKDLKSVGSPGATYGDRFLRNLGAPDAATPAVEDVTKPRSVAKWGQQLWVALDWLRGSLDGGALPAVTGHRPPEVEPLYPC